MARVVGTDHVLLLLRDKLARASRKQAWRGGASKVAQTAPRPLERLRAIAGVDALGEDERRRAVVHGLLVEEMGDAVANDAAFQGVLDDVMRIIAGLPDAVALVDRAAAALRDD